MAINIKDRETEELVRKLAKSNGQTVTDAVRSAARLGLQQTAQRKEQMIRDLLAIGDRLSRYPVVDNRSIDEMLYDENGLPK